VVNVVFGSEYPRYSAFLCPFFRFKEDLNEVEAMIARRRKVQYIEPASSSEGWVLKESPSNLGLKRFFGLKKPV
jgi:hypothetical protein